MDSAVRAGAKDQHALVGRIRSQRLGTGECAGFSGADRRVYTGVCGCTPNQQADLRSRLVKWQPYSRLIHHLNKEGHIAPLVIATPLHNQPDRGRCPDTGKVDRRRASRAHQNSSSCSAFSLARRAMASSCALSISCSTPSTSMASALSSNRPVSSVSGPSLPSSNRAHISLA